MGRPVECQLATLPAQVQVQDRAVPCKAAIGQFLDVSGMVHTLPQLIPSQSRPVKLSSGAKSPVLRNIKPFVELPLLCTVVMAGMLRRYLQRRVWRLALFVTYPLLAR